MDAPVSFRNTYGDTLAGVLSEPDKPNGKGVVLLHCFTCTKHHRILRNLSSSLSAAGFTALRFDFSGNGESTGKLEESDYTKMIGDVKEAVSLLRKRGMKKIGVAGHSMGAMLSALSAHEDKHIAAVGFIAGSSQAARVREVFPKEVLDKVEKEGSARATVYGREVTVKREFLHDVEKYNIGHAIATLKRPLLVVHGTADETIPVFHARQIYAWASEPKRLELIEGADHMFKKEEHLNMLMEKVSGWFGANL
jgi:uncharacterized protein